MATADEPQRLPKKNPRNRSNSPVYVRRRRGGGFIVQHKPRAKRKVSPIQRAWIDYMSQMACWSKYADPLAREYATQQSAGRNWYWRDVIERAMSGKLIVDERPGKILVPSASVKRDSAQSTPNGSWTALTPNALDWDNNSFWVPTTNPNNLLIKSSGLYMMGATAWFPNSTTYRRVLRIASDGVPVICRQDDGYNESHDMYITTMSIWPLMAGDKLTAYAYVNHSGQTCQLLKFWCVMLAAPVDLES